MAFKDIQSFKSMWMLTEINPKTKKLKATYAAVCLSYGREPIWGLWRLNKEGGETFIRFYRLKSDIQADYKHGFVWRQYSAKWNLVDYAERTAEEKHQAIENILKAKIPEPSIHQEKPKTKEKPVIKQDNVTKLPMAAKRSIDPKKKS